MRQQASRLPALRHSANSVRVQLAHGKASTHNPHETPNVWKVLFAASGGTLIEWYDFFIFGSLANVLALKFYPPGNDTFALIAYLATFAVGFVVRPFGALFFGRIGDFFGRRIAFIITLTVMGFATASIGLLPTFKTAGWFSPIVLIVIRVLQGLALGGEYGGAAVFVAEHVPDGKRGYYTSFIQVTASLGFVLSLAAIIATQQSMNPAAFQDWGWRLPFLLSIVLVLASLYIRVRMKESPIFRHLKATGMRSTKPLTRRFRQLDKPQAGAHLAVRRDRGPGRRLVHRLLLRAVLYAEPFSGSSSTPHTSWWPSATLAALPFYVIFGALSDRIGRKKLMMTSMLLRHADLICPSTTECKRPRATMSSRVSSAEGPCHRRNPSHPAHNRMRTGALVPARGSGQARNRTALSCLCWLQMLHLRQ